MALQYRLESLGWYDFERLVHALLKIIIGPGVSSFGGSKDQGRDASFHGEAPFPSSTDRWSGEWLFQAKFIDTAAQGDTAARRQLLRTFRAELEGVLVRSECECDNYILVTNVPLTPKSTSLLGETASAQGFSGKFRALGGKDICDLLTAFPQIRRGAPQLLGLADLSVVVDKAVLTRSRAYLEANREHLARFVRTNSYEKAWDILAAHSFLVLDGPPQAGKSFICAALAAVYAAQGYQVIDLRGPTDFFQLYDPAGKQFFLADDAIGTVKLETSLTVSWEQDLRKVVRTLNTDHVLVWTARTYILQSFLEASTLDTSDDPVISTHEVTVEVGDLSRLEKAEILYKHAKHARLPAHYRTLMRENATRIIDHPHFTPERARQLTTGSLVRTFYPTTASRPSLTWRELSSFLTNPNENWLRAFRSLPSSHQDLLVMLLDHTGGAETTGLAARYTRRQEDTGTAVPFRDVLSTTSPLRGVIGVRALQAWRVVS